MMNRCKFMNIALNTCGMTNSGCLHMADPTSCPNYDEDFDRSYVQGYQEKSPVEVAQHESHRVSQEVESLTEFANRIEGELDGMGIKVEKEVEVPDWF